MRDTAPHDPVAAVHRAVLALHDVTVGTPVSPAMLGHAVELVLERASSMTGRDFVDPKLRKAAHYVRLGKPKLAKIG